MPIRVRPHSYYNFKMSRDSRARQFPKGIPNANPKKRDLDIQSPAAELTDDSIPDLEFSIPELDLGESEESQTAPAHRELNRKAPRGNFQSLGVIGPLISDPEITEIMINDSRNIVVEKSGKLQLISERFRNDGDLDKLIENLKKITGKSLDPSRPFFDAMLPDGSRIHVITPPATLTGPCVTIRKFPKRYVIQDLLTAGTLNRNMALFLNACVRGRLNTVVIGGTGAGKTTLLGVLCNLIPGSERIVTIEDTPELPIRHMNNVRLTSVTGDKNSDSITAQELLANALRMRPDRIIVGECRRDETFEMLQAMNTGHEGSMTTIHANSPRDAIARIETLCLMAKGNLPLLAIRKQLASAIDILIQVKRFRDGVRRIVSIKEITGMEGETVTLQDIFEYRTKSGQETQGRYCATGLIPVCAERVRSHGIEMPPTLFSTT